ncbi:zinc-dependent metalloprotease [Yeosuana marina]|uniref:zinc-dependent metalloprotease n=1 Tax=Yeosuana marina TaxID=1565536 RepID=UPI00141F1D03|nr:zinc-dependent metalloprotease family protein [Yeosuana marina]
MKAKLHYVFSFAIFLIAFSTFGQNSSWKEIKNNLENKTLSKLGLEKSKVHVFEINMTSLKQAVSTSKLRTNKTKDKKTTISLPSHNGKLETFNIFESPVLSPSLALKYPNIKSYVGIGVDNPQAHLRMSVSPQGVQTMISYTDRSTIFMQPVSKNSNKYVLYNRTSKDNLDNRFKCETLDNPNNYFNKKSITSKTSINEGGANNQTLQKFRLAISTTAEYTAYHDDGDPLNGDAVADALAAINATLTRVNEVFETDMAVRFELVDATQLIYTDSTTDPYSDANVGASDTNFDSLDGWSLQLQNTLTSVIGNFTYDIGHLFGATGGGGNAGCIGCVCENDPPGDYDHKKGSGFTSPGNGIPEGDTFDINYVAHEIGHQMGANHTFAYATEGYNVNSEPGSGSTIMAYAGITGTDDIQANSDAYFHYHSIRQILDNLTTKSCQTTTPISNNPPSANAGNDYKIPAGTPYILKGAATDTDSGDVLTYCWEEIDSGKVDHLNFGPTLTSGSMNRSLPPSTSPNRYIPRLSSVLVGDIEQTNPGLGSDWETVASVDRFLNWALTVRDRNTSNSISGQSSYDTMQIEVIDGTVSQPVGPFEVTSQTTSGINWTQGNTETITWNVANTDDVTGINTSNVNILLSTDGGNNFDTVLKTNTPNDGTENITVPNIAAPFCRIMVEPVDNIYYAVNPIDFAIGYTITTTCNQQFLSSSNLDLPIQDGQETVSTINIPNNGAISNIKVHVNVTHSFISDLKVVLKHPNNTTESTLWEKNCFKSTGYADFNITFEDGSSTVSCASPTEGTYIPATPLSVFNGLDISGNWTLSIIDDSTGDVGVLNDWSLEFCSTTTTLNTPESTELQTLSVFPNPNKGEFTVSLKPNLLESNHIDIAVFDLRGRQVFKKNFKDISNLFYEKINLNNIQSGMYILNVSDGIRNSTKKLIIE